MKLRIGNWVGVHRTMGGLLHRLVHRRASDEPCYLCGAVWDALLAEPGFEDGLRAGLADMEAGRTVRWAELRERIR